MATESEIKSEGVRLLAAVREQMVKDGAADVQRVEPFEVNGHTLYLKSLTAERRAALWAWRQANPGDSTGLTLRLIAASVCDEDGSVRLTVGAAAQVSASVAARITDEIVRRNHMG